MKEWERKQKHHNEVLEILKEQKCVDSKNTIRRWKKEVMPALKISGHTSLDYKKCRCYLPALKK